MTMLDMDCSCALRASCMVPANTQNVVECAKKQAPVLALVMTEE